MVGMPLPYHSGGEYRLRHAHASYSLERSTPMTPNTFAELMEDRVSGVELSVSRIESQDGAEVALSNMRSHLMDILDLIGRHPGIEAAADDLYRTAEALVGANASDPRRLRLLREAHLRFRERIGSAEPRAAKP